MNKFCIILVFLFSSCTSRQEKQSILALKEISDLATVEYTVTKIIKANDNKTWYKVGDRKILISCEAVIKAGVDLSGISKKDFVTEGKNVQLKLPSPKIISFSLPPEKVRVEYQDIGMLRDKFKTGERDKLAAQAESQIKSSIPELGILQQAKINTSLLVNNILKQMGYISITITYSETQPSNRMQ